MALLLYVFLVKRRNATVCAQLLDATGNIKSGIRAERYSQNAIMYLESDKRSFRGLALLLCRNKLGEIEGLRA